MLVFGEKISLEHHCILETSRILFTFLFIRPIRRPLAFLFFFLIFILSLLFLKFKLIWGIGVRSFDSFFLLGFFFFLLKGMSGFGKFYSPGFNFFFLFRNKPVACLQFSCNVINVSLNWKKKRSVRFFFSSFHFMCVICVSCLI